MVRQLEFEMDRHRTTTFAEWVRQVFHHPVADPAWYWDIDSDRSEPAPHDCVAYLSRLFEEPELALARYPDAQVDRGLWYLVDNSCSNHMYSLIEPEVAWPQRRRGLRAMGILFERLFASRCSDHLGHLSEPASSPLNRVCYMWWDLFPRHGYPVNAGYAEVDAELLAVMRRVLALDSLACQESALHGLGHWKHHYPEIVEQTIDEFLARTEGIRQELREYAGYARVGSVQ